MKMICRAIAAISLVAASLILGIFIAGLSGTSDTELATSKRDVGIVTDRMRHSDDLETANSLQNDTNEEKAPETNEESSSDIGQSGIQLDAVIGGVPLSIDDVSVQPDGLWDTDEECCSDENEPSSGSEVIVNVQGDSEILDVVEYVTVE